jgi:predicted peptidase
MVTIVRALVVLAVLQSHAFAGTEVPVFGPGLHTATLERAGKPTIGYALFVPSGSDSEARRPLVLALHFGVQGGPSLGAGRSLVELLIGPAMTAFGAVIVAPDALDKGAWNTPQNEDAVLALLDAVIRSYPIDPKKVIVTGFSMGGAGTWHFAGKYPDRFAAAVPVAGRPAESAGSDRPRWRVPVFAVHSRRDQVVPIGPTEARIAELKREGVNAELVALDRPTHFDTSAFTDGVRQAVPWLRRVLESEHR